MRIVHVVTLVSADGSYGGPLTVARNLAAATRRLGHDVEVWGGARPGDLAAEPTRPGERRFRAWSPPRLRLVGLIAPALLVALWKNRRALDLVHVHASRDAGVLLAMLVLRCGRVPYVAQTHGMVLPPDSTTKRLVDLVARPAIGAARRCLALNRREAEALAAFGVPAERVTELPNGIDTWATPTAPSARARPVVCFVSRLHPRKRPHVFVEVAAIVGDQADFVLAGPDDGALGAVEAAVSSFRPPTLRLLGPLAVDDARAVIADADVLVLPADDEPFGVVILEAFVGRTAVVVTSGCHIAADLEAAGAALVTGPSAAELATGVEALLRDPLHREALVDAGRRLVEHRYSLTAVTDRLMTIYGGGIDDG